MTWRANAFLSVPLVIAALAMGPGVRADVAPGPPLTADQVRRNKGVDDCRTRKAGDSCRDMRGQDGRCGWFTWWWIPGTNDRVFENGKEEYASYVTTCVDLKKNVQTKPGKSETVPAFKCLVCM